jgi:hypothetical protein
MTIEFIFAFCATASIYAYGYYTMAHKPGVFFQPYPQIDYTSIANQYSIEMKPRFSIADYIASSAITTLYAIPMFLLLYIQFYEKNKLEGVHIIAISLIVALAVFYFFANKRQEFVEIKKRLSK